MVGVWILFGDPASEYVGDFSNTRALEFCRQAVRFTRGRGVRFTPPFEWTDEPFGDFYSLESAEEWLSTRIAHTVEAGLRPVGLPLDW